MRLVDLGSVSSWPAAPGHPRERRCRQNGILAGTDDVVKKIGGRQPTTLEEFITKHRQAFA